MNILSLLDALNDTNSLIAGVDNRDKVFKAVQFGARVLHLVVLPERANTQTLLRRLVALDKGVAQPRKLMRFGKAGGELATLLRPSTAVRGVASLVVVCLSCQRDDDACQPLPLLPLTCTRYCSHSQLCAPPSCSSTCCTTTSPTSSPLAFSAMASTSSRISVACAAGQWLPVSFLWFIFFASIVGLFGLCLRQEGSFHICAPKLTKITLFPKKNPHTAPY